MIASKFAAFSKWISRVVGHPVAFGLALLVVLAWTVSGPVFGFSDTWQLVINTGTTIVTFLMVFLIQSTQNRDTAAMQVKLDELIRVITGADDALIDVEEDTEEELEAIRKRFKELSTRPDRATR